MAHGDYTGSRKQLLAQEYANQQKLAAQHTSLVAQVVDEGRKEVIDLMTSEDYDFINNPTGISEDGEVQQVDTVPNAFRAVKFRASETLEDITVGKDRHFTLAAGQTYTAPQWVVEHLDDKGLVWH